MNNTFRKLKRIAIVTATVVLLSSCNTYGSLNIGAPFKLGPVYVNPSIGIGGIL